MIAVVIGSESSLSLSVSTQSQGGHRQSDVGVGGSEIRPGQQFQVQDQPETDRAGLGGAGHGRSTALRHCSELQPGQGTMNGQHSLRLPTGRPIEAVYKVT